MSRLPFGACLNLILASPPLLLASSPPVPPFRGPVSSFAFWKASLKTNTQLLTMDFLFILYNHLFLMHLFRTHQHRSHPPYLTIPRSFNLPPPPLSPFLSATVNERHQVSLSLSSISGISSNHPSERGSRRSGLPLIQAKARDGWTMRTLYILHLPVGNPSRLPVDLRTTRLTFTLRRRSLLTKPLPKPQRAENSAHLLLHLLSFLDIPDLFALQHCGITVSLTHQPPFRPISSSMLGPKHHHIPSHRASPSPFPLSIGPVDDGSSDSPF